MIIAGMLVMGSVGLLLLAVKAMSKSESFMTYARFLYASFLKPHTGDSASTGQQVALRVSIEPKYVGSLNSFSLLRSQSQS